MEPVSALPATAPVLQVVPAPPAAAPLAPPLAGPELEAQQRLERIEREIFEYKSARIQGVVHVPLIVLTVLYPSLFGSMMAVRLARMNLLVPTPHLNAEPVAAVELGGGQNLWRTDGLVDVLITYLGFSAITWVHVCLTSYLAFKAPGDAPYMARGLSWIIPMGFWLCTSTFLVNYVRATRYGPCTAEWVAVAVASFLTLICTLYEIRFPLMTNKVVKNVEGPGAPARVVAGGN